MAFKIYKKTNSSIERPYLAKCCQVAYILSNIIKKKAKVLACSLSNAM